MAPLLALLAETDLAGQEADTNSARFIRFNVGPGMGYSGLQGRRAADCWHESLLFQLSENDRTPLLESGVCHPKSFGIVGFPTEALDESFCTNAPAKLRRVSGEQKLDTESENK